MNKAQSLTREEIQSYGITSVFFERGKWIFVRESKNKGGYSIETPIHQSKEGGAIHFSLKGKTVRLDVKRLVWVWFFGDLTEDDAIVLIDGDQENLSLTNMKKVSREEAIRIHARNREKIKEDSDRRKEEVKELGIGVPLNRYNSRKGSK